MPVTYASFQAVIRKLEKGIQPLADRIMTDILQLINAASKTSTLVEDAFLVGALSAALEQGFAPYIINAFLPHLYPALKAHEGTQLCVAVGIIGDISRALGDQTAQYCQAFMGVLLENLQSDVLNRDVKISILACFGDLAMAIGPSFEMYLQATMGVLRQAGALQPNPVRSTLRRSPVAHIDTSVLARH